MGGWDGGCTDEMSCLLGGEVRQEERVAGTEVCMESPTVSSPGAALREVGGGFRRQWRSRACCASVRQRRWEDAADSRAAPGPEGREVWLVMKSISLIIQFNQKFNPHHSDCLCLLFNLIEGV